MNEEFTSQGIPTTAMVSGGILLRDLWGSFMGYRQAVTIIGYYFVSHDNGIETHSNRELLNLFMFRVLNSGNALSNESPAFSRIRKRPNTEDEQVYRRYNRQQSVKKRIFTVTGSYFPEAYCNVYQQGRRESKFPGCHD
jgi:hypothetical protein